MTSEELHFAVQGLQNELTAIRTELSTLRSDIAPLLKWKSGIAALVGLVVAAGMVARAVEYLSDLFKH